MSGGPERDEGGLPPVGVDIPDDARELDRDVQAYHRELRARRRRRRAQRLIAPFAGRGMVIPLIAATLGVTLFAGTMLTVITSAPVPPTQLPQPTTTSRAAPSVPPPGHLGGPLPAAMVRIGNRPAQLRDLSPSVLVLVPAGCGCVTALRRLTRQAVAKKIRVYFAGTSGSAAQAAGLAARVARGYVQAVDDVGNVLGIYHPVGVTAILVHRDGAVGAVVPRIGPEVNLTPELGQLPAPGLGRPASTAAGSG